MGLTGRVYKLGLARIGAFAIDYLMLAVYAAALSALMFFFLSDKLSIPVSFGAKMRGHLTGFLTLTLPVWAYFTLLESSPRQATVGKRFLRLKVLTPTNQPVRFGRAALRNAIKFLPWEVAHIAIWYVPGRPFLDPIPTTNLALSMAACLTSLVYVVSLFFTGGRTPYDRVSGTCVNRS